MKQMDSEEDFGIIDTVVNIWTPEALKHRPDWRTDFFVGKLGVDKNTSDGVSLEQLLEKMDDAQIEKAFLIATRAGPTGHPSCYRIPYELVAETCAQAPERLYGLAGIDPLDGMDGVYDLERAVKELGFIGAHFYPHWFEISPDAAKVYPFYAKCVELDIPIQLQVGQSMNYDKNYPRRSVGRPIALDPVACDFPQLKLIGIHIGIPWAEEMIAMAWKHQNVFIGSDAHSPKYWPESFKHYANTYGQDKVMFGTDFPVLDFKRTLAEIDALGLEGNSKRKLLRENALRVYRLNH
ncbi:MAG: amidohydrolase family protein [Pseudomonadota bacterium]|nr:amidohydrolase family protein [Pseudomonadota bacterium]